MLGEKEFAVFRKCDSHASVAETPVVLDPRRKCLFLLGSCHVIWFPSQGSSAEWRGRSLRHKSQGKSSCHLANLAKREQVKPARGGVINSDVVSVHLLHSLHHSCEALAFRLEHGVQKVRMVQDVDLPAGRQHLCNNVRWVIIN